MATSIYLAAQEILRVSAHCKGGSAKDSRRNGSGVSCGAARTDREYKTQHLVYLPDRWNVEVGPRHRRSVQVDGGGGISKHEAWNMIVRGLQMT